MATIGQPLTAPESGWKRIEAKDDKFFYSGNWSDTNDTKLSGGDSKATNDGTAKVTFKFYGTKLRIIGLSLNIYNTAIKITLDGVSETYSSSSNESSGIFQALQYEKVGLEKKVHSVEISSNAIAKYWYFDAIDIDEEGYLVNASVGQQLTTPGSGWKRYDDRDIRIKFSNVAPHRQTYGSFGVHSSTLSYVDSGTQNTTDTISFKFTGSKLILGVLYWNNNEHSGFNIQVDGVDLGNYQTGMKTSIAGSTVGFVKEDFSDGEHLVVLKNVDKSVFGTVNSLFALDFIDINSTGRLLHPDEVTDANSLTVGKRIRCNYSATSGVVGAFSNLGKETADFIPAVSSAPLNGDFYFIMVEDWNKKKILVADRNIQNAIRWDTLNSAGIASGSGLPIKFDDDSYTIQYTIRLLTGGITATDKDNEWDKYIVNSTLNGTITAGDDNVWNWSGNLSWASTTGTSNNVRILRGSTTSGYHGQSASSNLNGRGFRPVLEIEMLPLNKSFILFNGEYKKWNRIILEEQTQIEFLMTSNSTPTPFIATASSEIREDSAAWKAFNGTAIDHTDAWVNNYSIDTNNWISIDLGEVKKVSKYSLTSRANSTIPLFSQTPKDWTFEGSNNGVNWNVLDSRTGVVFSFGQEEKQFALSKNESYRYFRLNIKANIGGKSTAIAELKLFEIKPSLIPPSWETVSTTLPDADTFINEGMDDLSVFDRKSTIFNIPMDDNTSSGETLGNGRMFKEKIDLKKYIDITKIDVK